MSFFAKNGDHSSSSFCGPVGPILHDFEVTMGIFLTYKTSKGTKNDFRWVKEHVYILISAVQGKPENANFVSRMALALSRAGGGV